MPEVSKYFPGDLSAALDKALQWLLTRQNADVSPFKANAVLTPTTPSLVEGGISCVEGTFAQLAQDSFPSIVFDPLMGITPDASEGPDGFPINYSSSPLVTGNLALSVLPLTATTDVSGRVLNLTLPASQCRIDVFSLTDVFYYQGSSSLASDGSWRVASVHPGTAIAVLYPLAVAQPAVGSSFASLPAGWLSHSNLGVGNKLKDYYLRLFVKTDAEYLQEDAIPIIVQDAVHARFGSSLVPASGTPVAHIIWNDATLGPIDIYSTLQNAAVFADLPRSIEVPPGDPDYVDSTTLTSSTVPYIQQRCWIYDAALAIVAFSVAGLWDAAKRIVTRLNQLQADPGYLPSLILEDAQDGSAARWSLVSGAGSIANVFDSTEPPPQSGGSNVISFTATAAPAAWNFAGPGLPDSADSILDWCYKTSVAHKFVVGVTSSSGQVTSLEFVSSGVPGYDSGSKKITEVISWEAGEWRVINSNLGSLIGQYVPGESLIFVNTFQVVVQAAGNLRLDNLSIGSPQPEGSLSFSYDVYNGQVDQAYIRTGAVAWVAYAYGIYMERTGDYLSAAPALQKTLNFLFSLQCASSDLRRNLILGGWGTYQDPGYRYVPGQLTWVSTEHNVDCYFAFDKASRVLPAAAEALRQRALITPDQYAALMATSSQASQKAGEVKTALLTQLWIAPSGNTPGHFAQGASATGLDPSLALDASGSWSAMFCHEVGDDAKAVECLKFIYETFFLTGQQILKSSQPGSFNQTYVQLTPFSGFKPYADSVGGYSGSPNSVWLEGTLGALAAYLRLSRSTDLQLYFASKGPGGLDGFLNGLVASIKTVLAATGGQGLLAFSLASRPLPWEFSVRKTVASTAWFWITATSNEVLFTNAQAQPSGRPYLKIPSGVQQTIRDLDGQCSIGALELEAVDKTSYLTALASGGKLEGRKVTLKVGYPGMATADFVTLATQQIESVQPTSDLTGFVLQCTDLKRTAKTNVFTTGDDGLPVSRDHPRHLVANPMDVVLICLQNELGLGQVLPEEASWKLYDPAQWDSTGSTNPTLIYPNPYVDIDKFLEYRNGIFNGYLFEFEFDQPVEGKQFMEYEVFRPLGGSMLVLPDGRLSPRFLVPPTSLQNLFSLNERNIVVLPGVERQPIINQVVYRMDYDGNQFATELLFAYAPSLQQFGLAGEHIIESKGIRAARGGVSLAQMTANRIFRRYGGIDPVLGTPTGGASLLTVVCHLMTLTVEVGDFVFFSHSLLPNFETGRRGVFNRILEVIDKQPNYSEGTITYRLLDNGWLNRKKLSRIAPLGTQVFTKAPELERAKYMFVAQQSTGTYTDGSAAKTIF
jgi:hypothetical protein